MIADIKRLQSMFNFVIYERKVAYVLMRMIPDLSAQQFAIIETSVNALSTHFTWKLDMNILVFFTNFPAAPIFTN